MRATSGAARDNNHHRRRATHQRSSLHHAPPRARNATSSYARLSPWHLHRSGLAHSRRARSPTNAGRQQQVPAPPAPPPGHLPPASTARSAQRQAAPPPRPRARHHRCSSRARPRTSSSADLPPLWPHRARPQSSQPARPRGRLLLPSATTSAGHAQARPPPLASFCSGPARLPWRYSTIRPHAQQQPALILLARTASGPAHTGTPFHLLPWPHEQRLPTLTLDSAQNQLETGSLTGRQPDRIQTGLQTRWSVPGSGQTGP
jgi:hypothetical protein